MICDYCKGDNDTPCCNIGFCEAEKGATGITYCIHCYAELREVDGKWYHHEQFDNDGNLISPNNPQDYVW